jgi:hypothetical protein
LLAVLPQDRCGRFKPNADAAALVEISALGGYSTDDILGGQYRRHPHLETQPGRFLNLYRRRPCSFPGLIPEIDIWRAAQLMLKRYGEKALDESAARADELALAGDDGATTWRRIMAAVIELANKIPPWPGY